MARYDLVRAWFRTPGDKAVVVWTRAETNDWNTANASLTEDEYGFRGRAVTGLVLDIGGYLGTVALGVLIDNPTARVICVEPIPDNADLIERNALANGVSDRLTLVRGVVGRSAEPVSITYRFQGGENELHHAFVGNASNVDAAAVPHETVTYPAESIRDLVGRDEVSLCKIDCEGGEWGFFDGPGLSQLAEIVGEWHPTPFPDGTVGTQDRLRTLLEPTHVLTFSGPDAGPGGFTAVRR